MGGDQVQVQIWNNSQDTSSKSNPIRMMKSVHSNRKSRRRGSKKDVSSPSSPGAAGAVAIVTPEDAEQRWKSQVYSLNGICNRRMKKLLAEQAGQERLRQAQAEALSFACMPDQEDPVCGVFAGFLSPSPKSIKAEEEEDAATAVTTTATNTTSKRESAIVTPMKEADPLADPMREFNAVLESTLPSCMNPSLAPADEYFQSMQPPHGRRQRRASPTSVASEARTLQSRATKDDDEEASAQPVPPQRSMDVDVGDNHHPNDTAVEKDSSSRDIFSNDYYQTSRDIFSNDYYQKRLQERREELRRLTQTSQKSSTKVRSLDAGTMQSLKFMTGMGAWNNGNGNGNGNNNMYQYYENGDDSSIIPKRQDEAKASTAIEVLFDDRTKEQRMRDDAEFDEGRRCSVWGKSSAKGHL